MKNQALCSSKDKSKKLKCRPLQFVFGTLRVNIYTITTNKTQEIKKKIIQTESVIIESTKKVKDLVMGGQIFCIKSCLPLKRELNENFSVTSPESIINHSILKSIVELMQVLCYLQSSWMINL